MVRFLHNKNPVGFRNMIKGTSAECLIMWTDGRTITNYLRISKVIKLTWKNNKYTISPPKAIQLPPPTEVETDIIFEDSTKGKSWADM